jgi:hypothetical protein
MAHSRFAGGEHLPVDEPVAYPREPPEPQASHLDAPGVVQRLRAPRYVAIACNQAGYENLCRLVTEWHMAEAIDLAEAAPSTLASAEDPSLLASRGASSRPAAGGDPRRGDDVPAAGNP